MKKVIVAPLNWGLGHASRCIPMIKSLIQEGFTPVLASDGAALSFLQKEFPNLEILELPSYQIYYGKNLKWNLIKRLPIIRKAVKEEFKAISKYVNSNSDVVGIISDKSIWSAFFQSSFGLHYPSIASSCRNSDALYKSGASADHQKV